jgi:hypothetical protein
MCLGVGERQRRAPASAKDQPLFDAKVLAKLLDILNKIPRRVVPKVRMRATFASTALIEQNNPVVGRIKETTMKGRKTCTGPTVQKYNWLAIGVPALFDVQLVHVRYAKPKRLAGLNFRIQKIPAIFRSIDLNVRHVQISFTRAILALHAKHRLTSSMI